MIPRRAFCCLLLILAVPLLLSGCAMGPVRVTVYTEHSETETTGGPRRTNAAANKVGLSAACDLSPR